MNWTVLEISLSIIGGSIATLRPLLKALRIKGFSTTEECNASATNRHTGHGRSVPLGSLRGCSDLALGNDTTMDAESQWKDRAVTRDEISDATSRTGSEDMILTEGRIKVTTGVTITHV